MYTNNFSLRHIGPGKEDQAEMLHKIGAKSLDELVDQTVPKSIQLKQPLNIGEGMSEYEYLGHIKEMAYKNKLFKSYIGLGYHPTILPSVIQRNIFENPGWYTAYTPYQAEIAQGRLEALLNYQTMVSDLTGMELANASLLDEATAAAEAMSMLFGSRTRDQKKNGALKFFISDECFPQTISVVETRAVPFGIELVVGNFEDIELDESYFGAILQYPSVTGYIHDFHAFVEKAKSFDVKLGFAADLMSLAMLTPPGEFGADVVFGTTQRFGIPMGYGGPHAAYFATKEAYKRQIPGRIIGMSKDAAGNPALRMALQTREQHIKRDKATSNICTAQVLLAVMAGMYAVYHGAEGLRGIARHIHYSATTLAEAIEELGFKQLNKHYFDTIVVDLKEDLAEVVNHLALEAKINFLYIDKQTIAISLNETTSIQDLNDILLVLATAKGVDAIKITELVEHSAVPEDLHRTSEFMTHPVFNSYRSETDMMRYIKKLERKDLSLNHSMIPLGSCTMKLNAASEMIPLNESLFANIHPFVPKDQAEGYQEIIEELGKDLSEITGFHTVSFQPNSGAQGEYTGLLVIKAYHEDQGNHHRDVCLIPSSAHGTNPASASMAGMKIVVVKSHEDGTVNIDDLREKAEKYSNELSCIMITYPSTNGVYEEGIIEITDIIHQHGGLVYMDGANMNAQVGLTSPGNIGADVCHLNLHKTFAIPHGGGGPGMGPIGVVEKLAPFLPGHPVVECGGEKAIEAVSAAPYGSSFVLLISYAYIKMMGGEGLTDATKIAILNANYIKECLKDDYTILYSGSKGRVAHEMILECRDIKAACGVGAVDIAKRLMDYGFHAPTVSFPVAGTLMVEPTESESKLELDRFCDAMKAIREEARGIEEGHFHPEDNTILNAPHTLEQATSDEWMFSYSRQKAIYPLDWVAENKFWPSVRRVDDAYGDRNLICSCPAIEEYAEEV